jgi:hypothetical protein
MRSSPLATPWATHARFLTSALLLVLCVAPAPAARAAAWTFRPIVDATGPLDSFDDPAVNRHGKAVWCSYTDAGKQAIVTGDSAGTRIVALADGSVFYRFTGVGSFQLVSLPDLDDAGRVVFRGYRFNSQIGSYVGAAYLEDGAGGITALTSESDDSGRLLGWCNPAMSGSGWVAMVGTIDRVPCVFAGPAPAITTLADTAGSILDFSTELAVNDGGQVLVKSFTDDYHDSIFLLSGGLRLLIADAVRDGFVGYERIGGVNSSGVAAFVAQMPTWERALYRGTTSTLAPLASTEGTFSFFESPAVDDDGTIAFLGTLDDWRTGIFTGTDPLADRVIATGDTLFGAAVTSLGFGREGLSGGHLAFRYSLEGGYSGIAVATRVTASVPPGATASDRVALSASSPARGRVTVRWSLPAGARPTRLTVFDVGGRRVRGLGDASTLAGRSTLEWDGRDASGASVGTGVYFLRLESTAGAATARTVRLD